MPMLLSAESLKIGIVNTERLLKEAPQVKAASESLEKEFSAREGSLIKMRDELKRLDERLQRDGAIMSESERRKLELELVNQKREFQRAQNEFREDLNIRRNEEFSKIQQQIHKVITVVAKELHFDLIVEDFVYASNRVDITAQVLQRLRRDASSTDR